MNLTDDQCRALDAFSKWAASGGPEFRLLGAAGTGKSYLLREAAASVLPSPVGYAAPTHKAVGVLGEGRTLASTLGLRPRLNYATGREEWVPNGTAKLPAGGTLVVDEASMVNAHLRRHTLEAAAAAGSRVVWVGDPYQLPPVDGTAAVFDGDMPSAELREVVRQARGNPILRVAHQYRRYLDTGRSPDPRQLAPELTRAGLGVCLDPGALREIVYALYSDPRNSHLSHVRFLAYTNKKVLQANKYIRNNVFGMPADEPFLPGEVVIANSAMEDRGEILISNEQAMEVLSSAPAKLEGNPGWEVTLQLPDRVFTVFAPADPAAMEKRLRLRGKQIAASTKGQDERRRAFAELYELRRRILDLRHGYATTVHKSQGSTYSNVIINVSDVVNASRDNDVAARLLYVALTRASEQAHLTHPLPVIEEALA